MCIFVFLICVCVCRSQECLTWSWSALSYVILGSWRPSISGRRVIQSDCTFKASCPGWSFRTRRTFTPLVCILWSGLQDELLLSSIWHRVVFMFILCAKWINIFFLFIWHIWRKYYWVSLFLQNWFIYLFMRNYPPGTCQLLQWEISWTGLAAFRTIRNNTSQHLQSMTQ